LIEKLLYQQDIHTLFVSWIAGPSATGSEKGTPNSIISAPPFCMASKIETVSSGVGYPAVTKVTSAGDPWAQDYYKKMPRS
jgi:hypothetical protein